jgi:nicotinate-nucleotide adenylyltransferase
MKIGLFFGSFNPVHNGHLIIANYICETTELEKVWMVVSPQNPFKQKDKMLSEYDRLHLINLAIENNTNLKASDVEFKLPRPSYTIDTLVYLQEKFPQHQFSLIMGGDNLSNLHKWKNYELILERYDIYIYRRKGSEAGLLDNHPKIHFLDVPMLDLSATFIRENLKKGISMQYFMPDKVYEYIKEMNWYK